MPTDPQSTQTPKATHVSPTTQTPIPSVTDVPEHFIRIRVDGFVPQPYQGDIMYYCNRLEGDHGVLNNCLITWGDDLVTAAILEGNSWGGLWMSLNPPICEGQSINFSAILLSQIWPLANLHDGMLHFQLGETIFIIAQGKPQAPQNYVPENFPLIGLSVPDFEQTVKRLCQYQVEMPVCLIQGEGARWVLFHDPDGSEYPKRLF